jgi:hypothetical protein
MSIVPGAARKPGPTVQETITRTDGARAGRESGTWGWYQVTKSEGRISCCLVQYCTGHEQNSLARLLADDKIRTVPCLCANGEHNVMLASER